MLKRNPNLKPSLPGEILHELYLKRSGITIKAFAEAIGCTPKHVSNVIHGKARIEAELATRIAAVLGTTVELWLRLQNTTDMWNARQKMKGWKPNRIFYQSGAHA
jgi:addiction module HigA family antidote